MVITQDSAQSLAGLNRPVAANVRPPREQQDIALPLIKTIDTEDSFRNALQSLIDHKLLPPPRSNPNALLAADRELRSIRYAFGLWRR
jgi:hypothetical protein